MKQRIIVVALVVLQMAAAVHGQAPALTKAAFGKLPAPQADAYIDGLQDGLLAVVLMLKVKGGSEAPLHPCVNACATLPRSAFRRQVREFLFSLGDDALAVVSLIQLVDRCEEATANAAAAPPG
ncbi:hypothetical protein LuPra_05754 [Luteitalea pratensis]|uniref:Uncharacterized protein n=1 Tax=Luteitalea pratensis TaxID=1855912 RepID=A0A143PW99_LUTPR|nr:hypothetical protein [Luteitalea pratensis]AMY12478.1 hypothetical protein LuPra_05754 [Luteitalea pratensis]